MKQINLFEIQKEIWKDIPGYEGYYQVSNLSRVKSLSKKLWMGCGYRIVKETILKNMLNKHRGYLNVNLYKDTKLKTHRIHRLVAQAFIPNSENKATVNHKNGIKIDNRLENLEWNTYSENNQHAYTILNKKPATKGRFGVLNFNSKSIIMYSKTGEKIKEFDCIINAINELNINNISSVLTGTQKTAGGYIWKYKNKGKTNEIN